MRPRLLWLFLWLASALAQAQSAIDAYPFPNAELQARHEALIAELRCPQCLNTNLAGSDAMIAQTLRREVHRLLLEGKTDEEVRRFMQARYGDFILYNPRWSLGTWLLWAGPFLLLAVAALALARMARARRAPPPLGKADEARLKQLLAEEKPG